MTTWSYEYNGNKIEACDTFSKTVLKVNNAVQDVHPGLTLLAKLNGKLPTGEDIRVKLEGTLSVECFLFINDVLQEPISVTTDSTKRKD